MNSNADNVIFKQPYQSRNRKPKMALHKNRQRAVTTITTTKRLSQREALVKLIPRELRDICRIHICRDHRFQPSKKQLIKIMFESCLFKCIEIVFDAFTGFRHKKWKLSKDTIEYLIEVARKRTRPLLPENMYNRDITQRERCFQALREIGCIPWMGRIKLTKYGNKNNNKEEAPKDAGAFSKTQQPRKYGIPVIWGFGSRSDKSARTILYTWFVGDLETGEGVRTACGEPGCVNPTHLYKTTKIGRQQKSEVTIPSTMDKMINAMRNRVLFPMKKTKLTTTTTRSQIQKQAVLPRIGNSSDIEEDEEKEESEYLNLERPIAPVTSLSSLSLSPNKITAGDESDTETDTEWDDYTTDQWLEKLKEYDGFEDCFFSRNTIETGGVGEEQRRNLKRKTNTFLTSNNNDGDGSSSSSNNDDFSDLSYCFSSDSVNKRVRVVCGSGQIRDSEESFDFVRNI